jgi:hypothetical protein
MATKYDIRQDYSTKETFVEVTDADTSYLSSSPDCLVMVLPFKHPSTYSRATQGSASKDFSQAMELKPPIFINQDLLTATVQSNKNSHMGSLSFTCIDSGFPYMNEVVPGDWVFCWMTTSTEKTKELMGRLMKSEACNLFDDGLKFMGRISSVRESMVQTGGGHRQVNYNIQGVSFREFESQIFYDKYFVEKVPGFSSAWARLNRGVDDVFNQNAGGITTEIATKLFLDLIIGNGPPADAFGTILPSDITGIGLSPNDPGASPNVSGGDGAAPFPYCVPKEVGMVLGKTRTTTQGGILAYTDLLKKLVGVQAYPIQLNGYMTNDVAGRAFAPSRAAPLLGSFIVQQPQFTNTPLWSILQQYLNRAVNEMYATLRTDASGNVAPTLVIRQFPFTSERFVAPNAPAPQVGGLNLPVTKMLELPRWYVHPSLVTGSDLGRSDSMHFNFVHIYGEVNMYENAARASARRLDTPPLADMLDIGRSGVHMYPVQSVNCSPQDANTNGAGKWMAIVSDFAMALQMSMNGTLNIHGVQAPICIGDNVEYWGNVYHIESVTHSWSIGNGHRHFMTQLQLSHGMRDQPTETLDKHSGETFSDVYLYPNTDTNDESTVHAGTTSATFEAES